MGTIEVYASFPAWQFDALYWFGWLVVATLFVIARKLWTSAPPFPESTWQ